jgi:hypothetical protein
MKSFHAFSIGMVLACSSIISMAQVKVPAPSPAQTIKQAFGLGEITVEYSRPALKGRAILAEVAPADKVWRTGANATTKITFTDDVQLEGKAVAAGTYGLYTVPSKDSWAVMLYKDMKLAGNIADYKAENEVLRVTVKPVKAAQAESFTIGFADVMATSATLQLSWGKVLVPVKITCDIDSRVMSSIKTSMASDKPAYFQAATYYYDTNKDQNQALEWVNKAVEQNPKAFYMMLQKAKIELKLKDKNAAIASAEKAIVLSKEAKNDDYVRAAEALIKDAKK